MMNTIVNEKMISFKELEQKMFDYICEFGRGLTQTILESYDEELQRGRDKKALRSKGTRRTTIKTVYGEVEYNRNIYEGKNSEGRTIWVYLLDEAMSMDKIGLISTNLAEKIASTVTESSYHVTADLISSTCGQTISHGGVWNLVQHLGEKISMEEDVKTSEMDADKGRGEKIIPILFEEMDGVWLRMQGKGHKKEPKQEMKVSVTYEGWEKDDKGSSCLSNKHVMAGMEKSDEFHAKREAQIRSQYDTDEIGFRILNGDGGGWIKDPYEPETVFQLDRFHIHQDIKRKIQDKAAQTAITSLFEAEKFEEMFEYIEIYATSVESPEGEDKKSENARKLYAYLKNNEHGLPPWQSQRDDYPEAPEGIAYKNMGVQENQNCTTITLRMKKGRMRWSSSGANNMAKLLSSKENKELVETIGRYTDGILLAEPIREILEVLSAAKAPKKDGKGNPYIDVMTHHIPMMDVAQTASRKIFKKAFA
jgi:Uncharacterised protein family (UPF0236)